MTHCTVPGLRGLLGRDPQSVDGAWNSFLLHAGSGVLSVGVRMRSGQSPLPRGDDWRRSGGEPRNSASSWGVSSEKPRPDSGDLLRKCLIRALNDRVTDMQAQ